MCAAVLQRSTACSALPHGPSGPLFRPVQCWRVARRCRLVRRALHFFTTNPFSAACRGHCQGSVCLAAAMTQQVRPPRNCPRQAHLLRIASACLSLQGVRRAGRRHWCRRLPSRMQTGRRRLRHSVPAGTMPVPHLRRLRPWLLSAAAVPLG